MKFVWLKLNYQPCPPEEKPARFGFECPRKPGYICSGLMIEGADLGEGVKAGPSGKGKQPACWRWNGNRDKPTFTPSIHCLAHKEGDPTVKYGGCGWHGHIINGTHTGK